MIARKPRGSMKARAWRLAARAVREWALSSAPADVQDHMLDAVVPALRTRARIIERNARRK